MVQAPQSGKSSGYQRSYSQLAGGRGGGQDMAYLNAMASQEEDEVINNPYTKSPAVGNSLHQMSLHHHH